MKIALFSIEICLIVGLFTIVYSKKVMTPQAKDAYVPQDALAESMERGAVVYEENCAVCHLGTGEGVANTFPPLAKSDWLTPDRREEAIRVVKYGQQGAIQVNGKTYNNIMANLGLYEDEIADVMNYILNNWGNSSDKMVTEDEVKAVKEE